VEPKGEGGGRKRRKVFKDRNSLARPKIFFKTHRRGVKRRGKKVIKEVGGLCICPKGRNFTTRYIKKKKEKIRKGGSFKWQ